jgi:hypothetical protein
VRRAHNCHGLTVVSYALPQIVAVPPPFSLSLCSARPQDAGLCVTVVCRPLPCLSVCRVAVASRSVRPRQSLAPLYFLAFMVFGSLVMVNLFVAVVLVRDSRPSPLFTACSRFSYVTRSQLQLPGCFRPSCYCIFIAWISCAMSMCRCAAVGCGAAGGL